MKLLKAKLNVVYRAVVMIIIFGHSYSRDDFNLRIIRILLCTQENRRCMNLLSPP